MAAVATNGVAAHSDLIRRPNYSTAWPNGFQWRYARIGILGEIMRLT